MKAIVLTVFTCNDADEEFTDQVAQRVEYEEATAEAVVNKLDEHLLYKEGEWDGYFDGAELKAHVCAQLKLSKLQNNPWILTPFTSEDATVTLTILTL